MKIVTDCTADLTPADRLAGEIILAPMFVRFPDGEINAIDLTPDEFYDRLERIQPRVATTAQPSEGMLVELYQQLTAAGEEVLSIHLSSGLSGMVNLVQVAAGQVPGGLVQVVDSLSGSGGQRFQVLAAVRAARAGWSGAAIREHLELIRQATEVVYTLDTLKYLVRGGRLGRAAALASTLLDIKPIIHVSRVDGQNETVGKTRTLRGALESIATHLAQLYPPPTPVWVSIVHGRFAEPAAQLAGLVRQKLNVGQMDEIRLSPILGVHSGPHLVGATVMPLPLMEMIK